MKKIKLRPKYIELLPIKSDETFPCPKGYIPKASLRIKTFPNVEVTLGKFNAFPNIHLSNTEYPLGFGNYKKIRVRVDFFDVTSSNTAHLMGLGSVLSGDIVFDEVSKKYYLKNAKVRRYPNNPTKLLSFLRKTLFL